MSFELSNYKITYGIHRDREVIFFEFPNTVSLRNEIKSKVKAYWSRTNMKWYTLDTPQARNILGLPIKPLGQNLLHRIHPINRKAFIDMRQMLVLKGYSINTQRTYLSEFAQFLIILKTHFVQDLSIDKVKSYIYYCSQTLKLQETSLHSRLNAIKFYYDHVLRKPDFYFDIPRPKKPSTLPQVISKLDLKKMFSVITNPKHRVILQLVYGMGLRVSESVGLKITDIDSKRMQVHIRCAKGKKDRYVPLPFAILEEIRAYYRDYRPREYLFEGQGGGQYSVRSVQMIFKNAMRKAKINKQIGIHGLRHSYATHLLEAGTDTLFIKELLGHSNIKTTMIYTHVADVHIRHIQSPLDTL